jgi:hypothetical protein
MVMNNRGWLRIVEASVAILLVLGAVLLIGQGRFKSERIDYTEIERGILDDIGKNDGLRVKILQYNFEPGNEVANALIITELKDFIRSKITIKNAKFDIVICSANELCFLSPYPGTQNDVFSLERMISSDIKSSAGYSPRKIKIFMWKS